MAALKRKFSETEETHPSKRRAAPLVLRLIAEAESTSPPNSPTIEELLSELKDKGKSNFEKGKIVSAIAKEMHNSSEGTLEIEIRTVLSQTAELPAILHSQVITLVLGIVKSRSNLSPDLINEILRHAVELLDNSSHLLRIRGVELTAVLWPLTDELLPDDLREHDVLEIFNLRMIDIDPRVRGAVFQALCTLHARHFVLSSALYQHAKACLNDSFECVRLHSMKLLSLLCQLFKDHMVTSNGESFKMVDDGFVSLCDMINDQSMGIRIEACNELAKMSGVAMEFLEQTFDKKIISHLRRKKTEHELMKEKHHRHVEEGEGPPVGDIDVKDTPFINSGACGAFIHGLEDEKLEVRDAAVRAIEALCLQHPSLAAKAVDFLSDMLNDEIDLVRVSAVQALASIAPHVVFYEEQVELVLGALLERNSRLRHAIHDLMGSCRLASYMALSAIVNALLANITRYPDDLRSIWRCLHQLGSAHHQYGEYLIEPLLRVDFHFTQVEPNADDNVYIGVLIFCTSCAAKNKIVIPLFPSFVSRHYRFLREKYPSFFPLVDLSSVSALPRSFSLPRVANSSATEKAEEGPVGLDQEEVLLRELDATAAILPTCPAHEVLLKLSRLRNQISSVGGGEGTGSWQYASLCVQWLTAYYSAQNALEQGQFSISLSTLMSLSLQLRATFAFYSTEDPSSTVLPFTDTSSSTVVMMACLTHVLYVVQQSLCPDTTPRDLASLLNLLLQRLSLHREVVPGEALASFEECVCRLEESLSASERAFNPMLLRPIYQSLTQFSRLIPVSYAPPPHVVRQSASFLLPAPSSQPLNAIALVPMRIRCVVQVNFCNHEIDHVAIKVQFPNGDSVLHRPNEKNLKLINHHIYEIDTAVHFTLKPWTDASDIVLTVVKVFNGEIPSDPLCVALSSYPASSSSSGPSQSHVVGVNMVELSTPLLLPILPAKRRALF